ncbi:hypothetical protein [Modicisalibacter coralii]|uniref:hypothetical protein n=1 Tax=Modicisalibacter coralii TaxID=2304602 RepID=UPI00100ABB8E|nr:hypothetical protein [Halomonas coralii]
MHHQDDDNARSPLLKLLIVITLLTMIVAVGYLISYYTRGGSEEVTWYPPDMPCDLHHGSCHAGLGGGGGLTLSLGGAIVPLETLPIDVRLDGIDARRVVVEFIGRNMNLGLNRYVLERRGAGHYHGRGLLSSGGEAITPWRVEVIVSTDEGRVGSWFDVDVHRRVP